MSTILIASVAASSSSKAAGARKDLEKERLDREDLAKSQDDGEEGATLLVPPWHAAARHASLCAVDLSIGVRVIPAWNPWSINLHIDLHLCAG